jgi:hypothetical protein
MTLVPGRLVDALPTRRTVSPDWPTTPMEKHMCRPVTCKRCGKTTWAGCGQHVAQVRAAVPAGNWCPGHPNAPREGGAFSRLLRRS